MLELLQYRAWLLNEAYFNEMFPVVSEAIRLNHNLVKKKSMEDFLPGIEAMLSVVDDINPPQAGADVSFAISTDAASGMPVVKVNGKNIALMSVIGPVSKYGDLCTPGMQAYQSRLNRANNSPTIDGIVIIMDTPGGTVDGTPEFGLAIKNSMKPVGIFGDGMVASAGLWLASQAAVIVGNKNNPTEFGSIGVLMGLPNYQNQVDAGYKPKVTIYRAAQSTEKALINPYEAVTADQEKALIADLSAVAADFISIVKAGRGDKLDTKAEGIFSGRMFDVNAAKKNGLIDAVGTLQTAVRKWPSSPAPNRKLRMDPLLLLFQPVLKPRKGNQ
jgi:protease-4